METLLDPLNDRFVKSVVPPPHRPLATQIMYPDPSNPTVPNLKAIREHLLAEGSISKSDLVKLIKDVSQLMKKEANIIKLQEPVIIVGDIHGQYYDMIHMFEKVVDSRVLGKTRMLFLGDYVDRGIFSIEVLIFLYTLKLNYPNDVILLRGNHESRAMTEHFTFRNEVLSKYREEEIYNMFLESFETMPLAAVVNNDYLCMHGGISPQLNDAEDINKINRFIEPPLSGVLCDLLWSDPVDDSLAMKVQFSENKERECSVKFGLKPIKAILKKNNFLSIIRAHQVQIDGYKMHRWGGSQAFPSVITVFSAPNYCGTYSNKGAVILIENDKMNIKQYKDVDHPFHLPGDIDLFAWSIPFLAEKVTEMLFQIVGQNNSYSPHSAKELEQIDFSKLIKDAGKEENHSERIEILRTKVKTVARLQRLFKNLRENREMLVAIKKQSSDGKIPRGLLLSGTPAIKNAFSEFEVSKQLDKENEKFPRSSLSKSPLVK